nr:MAG TPA: hypothetical protein [Caudoviricetes sp.]
MVYALSRPARNRTAIHVVEANNRIRRRDKPPLHITSDRLDS